jgi:hypothetical protein
MRVPATMVATAALFLCGGYPAIASCGPAQQSVQMGTATGEPEKDTFGLICASNDAEQPISIFGRSRARATMIGISTGDAEKDTFAYRVVGSP